LLGLQIKYDMLSTKLKTGLESLVRAVKVIIFDGKDSWTWL